MDTISLGHDPVVQSIVDVQRRLSEAESSQQLSFELATRLRGLAAISHAASLDVRGLAPGHCRARYVFDLRGNAFCPQLITDHSLWDVPPEHLETLPCPTLARLAAAHHPTLVRGIEHPVWSRGALPDRFDAVFVPVFAKGEVAEWVVLVLEDGASFNPQLTAVLLSSINSHARIVQQFKLAGRLASTAERLDWQLQRVGALQRSILPPLPAPVPGLSVAAHYAPCNAAGGDYYEVRRLDDGTIGALIADVSGHGVDAAVVMAMVRSTTAAYWLGGADPHGLARHLNRVLCELLPPGMFVTAQFVFLDPSTWEGVTMVAGHPPARLRREGGRVEPLGHATAPPLGLDPDLPDEPCARFGLDAGDAVVLYTDGLTEARSPDLSLFGFAGLDRSLRDPHESAESLLRRIVRDVAHHAGGAPPDDDQCAVILRRDN
ncbi:MAG: PP2C family protein-serine/threonine phosphatase [Phycisphaerales bacterium JB041]